MSLKKYSMVLWVIMAAWVVQAMDLPSKANIKDQDDPNLVQITTPYRPKFAVRHPNITNAGKSLAVGGMVAAVGLGGSKAAKGNIEREDVVASGILGTIAAIGNYLYNLIYPKPVSTIDSLLTDPLELSQASQSTADTLNEFATKNKAYSQQQYLDYLSSPDIQTMIDKNPISLLAECETGGMCVFDRSSKTGYREKFAEYVTTGMINQINEKRDQRVNYTSFGSGGGLQDMIVLTKVLAQKPDSSLNIHLIDRQNRIFVRALDYFKMKREIGVKQPDLDFFGHRFNEYVQIIKAEDLQPLIDAKDQLTSKHVKEKDDENLIKHYERQISSFPKDEDLKVQLTTNCLQRQKRYKQFITFLTKTFPRAPISLFIHDSADSYCNYLNRESLGYPDVLVAADIQDQMSGIFNASIEYGKLCQETLKNNPKSFNAWLAMVRYDEIGIKTAIMSLSLLPVEGAKEKIFQEYRWNKKEEKEMPYGEKIILYSTIKYLN